jgi:hypothetical protein
MVKANIMAACPNFSGHLNRRDPAQRSRNQQRAPNKPQRRDKRREDKDLRSRKCCSNCAILRICTAMDTAWPNRNRTARNAAFRRQQLQDDRGSQPWIEPVAFGQPCRLKAAFRPRSPVSSQPANDLGYCSTEKTSSAKSPRSSRRCGLIEYRLLAAAGADSVSP